MKDKSKTGQFVLTWTRDDGAQCRRRGNVMIHCWPQSPHFGWTVRHLTDGAWQTFPDDDSELGQERRAILRQLVY